MNLHSYYLVVIYVSVRNNVGPLVLVVLTEPPSAGGGYSGDYIAERRTFWKWQGACYLFIEHSFSTAGNKVFSDFDNREEAIQETWHLMSKYVDGLI
jgi:hypothetical protein